MSLQLLNPTRPTITRLAVLRQQLVNVRRRRHSTRVAAAWLAMGLALCWTLVGIFLLDWQLTMSRPQRLVALAIGAGAVAWTWRRFARPLLARREGDLDVALLIQREQKIDSDLVAALQFELPEAVRWGSPHLERAVIDRVAQFSRREDVGERLTHGEPLVRRGLLLAVTLAALIAAVAWQPRYAGTFLLRLAFASRHYPTATQIDEVQLNGQIVTDGEKIRAGYGQPIRFAVRASGEMPADVRKITLRPAAGGSTRPIELTASTAADGQKLFTGELPQLVDTLEYQVYLGDAWTDPSTVEVIPLPVVETQLTATPPEYARSAQPASAAKSQGGYRQLSVLEGSRVDLRIRCANKGLQSAVLSIDKKHFPLQAVDQDRREWALPEKDSALARVEKPLRYEVEAIDEDGLQLPHPLDGYIHTQTDRPPVVAAAVDVQFFLPTTGLPHIHYSASDDYGLSRLRLIVQIVRDGSTTPDAPREPIPLPGPLPDQPVLRPNLPLAGIYRLPLDQFKLTKGDQVQVTVEATDYRGDQPGKTTHSEPLLLHITDESGIMAALGDADLRAAQQMDALIQRQTETGGSK